MRVSLRGDQENDCPGYGWGSRLNQGTQILFSGSEYIQGTPLGALPDYGLW